MFTGFIKGWLGGMTSWVILAVAVLALVIVALILARRPAGEYRKHRFMTDAEVRFFRALMVAIGGKYQVFAKPRLNDIIYAVDPDRSKWQSMTNKLQMKHVDFLLNDKVSLEPVCVVELDDSSHNRSERKARDNFVNAALKSAGVPIVHFSVKVSYSSAEILQKLTEFR